MPKQRTEKERLDAFWEKVNKKGPFPQKVKSKKEWKKTVKRWPEIEGTRCWDWIGPTIDGYGIFYDSSSSVLSHRFALYFEIQ
jgi:hypothetical protein